MSQPAAGLPAGWVRSVLRRVAACEDHRRAPLNAEERSRRPGKIPYWGANSIQGHVDVPLVEGPLVLLGEDGAPFFDSTRPVAFYIDEPIWPNNHVHVLRPRSGIDGRWLAYSLNAVDYSRYISGATRDKLTKAAMLRIDLAVPPHDRQTAMADFLDAETSQIDRLVGVQRQFITSLRERASALQHAHFQATDGKRMTTVRRVLQPQRRPAVADLGVVTAYRDGVVTLRSKRREEGYTMSDTEHGYQEVRPGDLVFHALDGFAGAVGISDSHGNATPVYHVCRPIAGDDAEYLAMLLRYLGVSGFLATQAPNVRQRSVDFRNWNTFARVPLALPSVEEQREVVASIIEQSGKIDALIDKAKELVTVATERRTALIAAVASGEADIPDDLVAVA